MRHGQPDATDRVRRATHAAVTAMAITPVLVLIYLQVMGRRIARGGRSRALTMLAVTLVGVAVAVPSAPWGGSPAAARPDMPATTAEPSAGTQAAPDELLALTGGATEARPGDALRPAIRPDAVIASGLGETASPSPAVVRFRPLNGATGVTRSANVSVRFNLPMDRASTQPAFRASVDGVQLGGTYSWAEGDTVLVLDPATLLPYAARVELRVESGATSAGRVGLAATAAVTFTVEPAPRAAATPSRAPAGAVWQWPLAGPITQYFGQSLTQYGYHYGIDIDGETGDPVRAAWSGRVVVAGAYDECGGLEVHVDHGDGLVSWYRHLSRIDVAAGDGVTAGTIIGLVGNTGCSLGSHLHFAIRQGSTFVDPLPYLPPR